MHTANTSMQLTTSRYQARDLIVASGLAPVRVTLGAPKFALGYELAGEVRELAPRWGIFRLPWERFAPAYVEQLDTLNWPQIEERLAQIAGVSRAVGCVLLCFEDVSAGERCHRRLLASHWERRVGTCVPELT
jgi:hypothetical protein